MYHSSQPQTRSLPTSHALEREVVSVGSWIVTFILLTIPFVGLIFMFYWAFSSSTHPSKKNYAKANLIIVAVFLVLWLLMSLAGLNIFAALLNSGSGQ
jgi:hypothetical protein